MSNRRRNQSMNMLIYLMVLLKERAFGLISLMIAIALFTYPLYKGKAIGLSPTSTKIKSQQKI